VAVDSQTVFANVANFDTLTVGTHVEVHGLRDANGNLRASRVELVGMSQGADEVRGTASSINTSADTFVLNGNIIVNYAGATFSPAGASESSLGNGIVVEVRGRLAGGSFTAAQVDIEGLEDDSLRARTDEEEEVEASSAARRAPGQFPGGRAQRDHHPRHAIRGRQRSRPRQQRQGRRRRHRECRGRFGGAQDRVSQRPRATQRTSDRGRHGAGTIVVLGQTVRSTSLTRIETRRSSGSSTSLVDLTPNVDCVEVRATIDGSTIVADEIKEPSSCGKELVQADGHCEERVHLHLDVFGSLSASLAGTSKFLDRNERVITRAQFFAAWCRPAPRRWHAGEGRGQFTRAVEEAELQTEVRAPARPDRDARTSRAARGEPDARRCVLVTPGTGLDPPIAALRRRVSAR